MHFSFPSLPSRTRAVAAFVSVASTVLASVSAADAQILTENFDGLSSGGSFTTISSGDPAGVFTVSAGSVDVVDADFLGAIGGNPPGNVNYIDLDGSTTGALTASSLTLQAGTVQLNFLLAGSQRGDTNTVRVSLIGTTFVEDFTLASADPFTSFTRNINVGATTNVGQLIFDHTVTGGDALGLLLDNVSLSQTSVAGAAAPEPGTCALLATGLLGMAGVAVRRRRSGQ